MRRPRFSFREKFVYLQKVYIMDERYKTAESRCTEKIVSFITETWGGEYTKMKSLLVSLVTNTAKIAFAEGYDAGYCNGADDARDID